MAPIIYAVWDWGGDEVQLIYKSMRDYAAYVAGGSGTPIYYTFGGDEGGLLLRLFPAPDAAGTSNIYVEARRLPVDFASSSTVCELPADTHDAVNEYTCFLAWREWEEPGRAMEHKGLYDEMIQDLVFRYQMPSGGWPIVDTQFGVNSEQPFTGYTEAEMSKW